ncbi:glycosyltransferase family 2 protein [Quadrisphaera setariae]|uniref:glycosyltransferase family 2 protein n=1 Tax=Quadrisphaera setariae TaxID=2593304 RepID=UPI001C9CF69E|nr:glycosyltransferase family 2 protein [Quadrisphaera setariae]
MGQASSGVTTVCIVVNYFSSTMIERCLEAMLTELPNRIVIYDNSCDESEYQNLERLKLGYHNLEVLRGAKNLGFGAGVNAAIGHTAQYEPCIFWVLNPDAVPQPGCLNALQEAVEANEMCLVSSVVSFGETPTADQSIWFYRGGYDLIAGKVWHDDFRAPLNKMLESQPKTWTTPFLPGTSFATNLETWERLGGFREDLFLYWEDVELCERAQKSSIKTLVARDALVWHGEGGTTNFGEDGHSKTYYYWMNKNRYVISGTHSGRKFVGNPAVAWETFKCISRPLLTPQKDRLGKTWSAIRGTKDGIMALLWPPRPSEVSK